MNAVAYANVALLTCLYFFGAVEGAGFAKAPANMLAWFNAASCPTGWSEYTDAQGQVIVATSSSFRAGISTDSIPGGAAWRLSNQQQPSHSHDYSRDVCASRPYDAFGKLGTLIPIVSIFPKAKTQSTGVISCNTDASSTFGSSEADFPFAQLRLCQTVEEGVTVPVNTIAHFSNGVSSCPNGWEPYFKGEGRSLRPKDVALAQPGSFHNGVSALDTSASIPENRLHQHGIETKVSLGGPGRSVPATNDLGPEYNTIANGRDLFDLTGLSDAAGLNVPFAQMLTCKASEADTSITIQKNPPQGALMFFDDIYTDSCPPQWSDTDVALRKKLLLALPSGESPAVWATSGSPRDHTHMSSFTIEPPYQTASNFEEVVGGDPVQNVAEDGLSVRVESVPSSEAFHLEWISCSGGLDDTCNQGGGKVLARFGARSVGASSPGATSAGEMQYNYMVKDGPFTCNNLTFGGDPTLDGSLIDSCDIVPILEEDPFPSIQVRFCSSNGFTGTAPPTFKPTPAPLPTPVPVSSPVVRPTPTPVSAPITPPNECSVGDAATWFESASARIDQDSRECAQFCQVEIDANFLTNTQKNCLLGCLENAQTVSTACASCMVEWVSCFAVSCPACDPGDNFAGRSEDDLCNACTEALCNADFAECAGGGMVIPRYAPPTPAPVQRPEPEQGSSDNGGPSGAAIGAICGAVAGALFFGAAYFTRMQDRKEVRRLATALKSVTTDGPASRTVSIETSSADNELTAEPLGVEVSGPVRLKATFDFIGEFEDELSIKKGDILNGISRDGDWYYVENESGKTGLVPCSWLTRSV